MGSFSLFEKHEWKKNPLIANMLNDISKHKQLKLWFESKYFKLRTPRQIHRQNKYKKEHLIKVPRKYRPVENKMASTNQKLI